MKKILSVILALAAVSCNPGNVKPDTSGDGSSKDPSGSPVDNPSADPSAEPGQSSDPVAFEPEAWYSTPYFDRTDREKLGLRGPVKTVDVPAQSTVYEFDRAGHVIYAWYGKHSLTRYYYDDKGRLIKKEEGTPASEGSHDFYESEVFWKEGVKTAGCIVTEYEYGSGTQYVFASEGFDIETENGIYRKLWYHPVLRGLSAIHQHPGGIPQSNGNAEFMDYTFTFSGSKLTISRDWYYRKIEVFDGTEEGWHYEDEKLDSSPGTIEVTYDGDYPVNCSFAGDQTVEWFANGIPKKVVNDEGTYVFCEGSRYLNLKRWDCPEGKPMMGYWTEYDYNDNEDVAEMRNGYADWTRVVPYYDYVYDSYGNWTSFKYDIQEVMGGPEGSATTFTASRTITYFE